MAARRNSAPPPADASSAERFVSTSSSGLATEYEIAGQRVSRREWKQHHRAEQRKAIVAELATDQPTEQESES